MIIVSTKIQPTLKDLTCEVKKVFIQSYQTDEHVFKKRKCYSQLMTKSPDFSTDNTDPALGSQGALEMTHNLSSAFENQTLLCSLLAERHL